MSNRRETAEGRLQRMHRNGRAEFDTYQVLEAEGVELDKVMLRKRYLAARRVRRASRGLTALRNRRVLAIQKHMSNEPKEAVNG